MWASIAIYFPLDTALNVSTNKECKVSLQGELQTTPQRSKRGHKQMEKHSTFMVKKIQYHENGHTAQSNLWIQCYPY